MRTCRSGSAVGTLRVYAASVVLVSVFTAASLASANDDLTPCERLGTHEVAFVGVAQEPTSHLMSPAPGVAPRPHDVQPLVVERAFRGVVTPIVYLTVAPILEEGRSYLVYANRLAAPPDVVVPMFLKAIEDAGEDLEFLETAMRSLSGPTINGVLSAGDLHDASKPRKPLADVKIRVMSRTGEVTSIVTDEHGQYSISGIPEGLVWLEASLPDHLIGASDGIDARAGGCIRQHIVAIPNGRIRGRVVRHDGKPFDWLVDLLPADTRRAALSTQRVRVNVDEKGNFEFSGRPPGEYLLGVNLLRPPTAGLRYKPTYYPGTSDRKAAIPIVVGEGTIHEGIDLMLSEEVLRGEIEVRVESRDKPDEIVVCFQEISNEFGKPGGTYPQLAPDIPIVIKVLDGLRYRVTGHVESGTDHFDAEVIEVMGTAVRQTLTLKTTQSDRVHAPENPCGSFFAGGWGLRRGEPTK